MLSIGMFQRILMRRIVAWVLVAAVTPAVSAVRLIDNVHGYTLVGGRLERFDAMAFDGGKVVATGESGALHRVYADAERIDGQGRTLLPGLIDAHGHVLALGLTSRRIDLSGTTSLADAQSRIRTFSQANLQAKWLLGAGWNQEIWKLGRFPTAGDLDAVIADRPVVLDRVDGHAKWLNTRALVAAGITRHTSDPPGGRIERDAHGDPSGILVDNAMGLIERKVPRPSDGDIRAALRAAFAEMNAVGLTGVADAGVSADEVAIYRSLGDAGQLSVRIYAMIRDTGADFATLAKKGPLLGYAHDRLTVRSVKLFADGALGSRGAALLAPYADDPGQHGLLFMSNAQMQHKLETAMRAGYQVNIHAIGDAANRQVLDAFEAAYKQIDGRSLRNRIEHAQVLAPSDIPRVKQLQLVVSMQPTHATSDMNMAEKRIGPERLKGAYAWRSFLDQGTVVAAGSDFPVESPNPFFGLHAAVTRTDHAGLPQGGWHIEQGMTLLEAFRAFTVDAAYAESAEDRLGSLEPGKLADFILVDRDLFDIPPDDIWKIRVEQTWLAGERVH